MRPAVSSTSSLPRPRRRSPTRSSDGTEATPRTSTTSDRPAVSATSGLTTTTADVPALLALALVEVLDARLYRPPEHEAMSCTSADRGGEPLPLPRPHTLGNTSLHT